MILPSISQQIEQITNPPIPRRLVMQDEKTTIVKGYFSDKVVSFSNRHQVQSLVEMLVRVGVVQEAMGERYMRYMVSPEGMLFDIIGESVYPQGYHEAVAHKKVITYSDAVIFTSNYDRRIYV